MDRITQKDLQYVVDRINRITGSPMAPWKREGDKMTAQIGNYHLSGAYGGVCLHRITNEGGGVTCPIGMGHVPKRELYERMHAYIAGLEAAKGAQ